MKKLLALMLSLCLSAALLTPALAAEESQKLDPPLWRQQGAFSYEDYLAWENLTEEDYAQEEARWLAAGADTYYDPAIAAWLAAHPEEAAAFDADAWFAEIFPDADKDAFMFRSLWSGDEHDFFVDMRYDWAWTQLSAEDRDTDQPEDRPEPEDPQAQIDRWIGAMGGTTGQLNLMVNGAYLSLSPGMGPYAEDGTTYLSADQLSQLLGVPVEGSGADGWAPLRLNAEAAGWTVWWDQDYQTVVLLDPKALANQVDLSFTSLNALLTPTANQIRTGDLHISLPARDGTVQEVPVSYQIISGADGRQVKAEADLSYLASSPEAAEALQNTVIEFRTDYAGEKLYLHAPTLMPLLKTEAADPFDWLQMELPSGGTSLSLGWQLTNLWLGYFSLDSSDINAAYGYKYVPGLREQPVTAWHAMCAWAEDCSRTFGEEALNRGGVALDKYDTFGLLWDMRLTNSGNLKDEIASLLQDFRFQAERDDQGGLNGELCLLVDSSQGQTNDSFSRSRNSDLYLDLTCRFSGLEQENALTLRYQGLSVTWQETCAAAEEGPSVTPPKDATVVEYS